MPKSSNNPGATASGANSFDDALDKIVGWDINRTESTVTLHVQRSGGGAKRKVPEDEVQRENEDAVVQYWESFSKPRETTVKCAQFRIFQILGHDKKRLKLKVHWVGYKAEDSTMEPVSNMLDSLDKHLVEAYLDREGLTPSLQKKKEPSAAGDATPGATAAAPKAKTPRSSATPAAKTAATPASKRRRAATPPEAATITPPAKRARGSAAKKTALATKTEKEDEEPAQSRPAKRSKAAVPAGLDENENSGSLYKFELYVSGLPRDDVVKLWEIATKMSTQPNAVQYRCQITPLPDAAP